MGYSSRIGVLISLALGTEWATRKGKRESLKICEL